ncbi:MAG: NAD(P)-binding protein [Acidobacteria bacterium]|nr:NAD(P)-binding protein [Acidobacteriota bacterium]
MRETIRVLGAGVSGLGVAALLARRGVSVEVRDRREVAGGRFTGGFQVLENGSGERDVLDELAGMGLEPACELTPLHEAILLDVDRNRHHVHSRLPYAYLIRRGPGPGTLDSWLVTEAQRLGARIEAGTADTDWTPDVIATGPPRADGVAREVVFETPDPDLIVVLFDPELTPTGYSYLFIHDGMGTMGAAQVRGIRRLRANARRAFDALLGEFPTRMEHPREHVQYMSFALPRHLEVGERWYVGEAAGIQDGLFGLGNRLALRSANLAAGALAGEGWNAGAFRRQIVEPMEASILGRAMFELAGGGAVARLCRWLAAADFRRRLIALQRPSAVRRLLARAVMAAWRKRGNDPRIPTAAWSRRPER